MGECDVGDALVGVALFVNTSPEETIMAKTFIVLAGLVVGLAVVAASATFSPAKNLTGSVAVGHGGHGGHHGGGHGGCPGPWCR